jgi:hypothetical protein
MHLHGPVEVRGPTENQEKAPHFQWAPFLGAKERTRPGVLDAPLDEARSTELECSTAWTFQVTTTAPRPARGARKARSAAPRSRGGETPH